LRAGAADRAAAGGIRTLSRQENSWRTIQHLDSHDWKIARSPRDPSVRTGLCLRYDAARHRAGPAWAHAVRKGVYGSKPRSRAVASPAISRRRVVALRAGFPEFALLAWIRAGTYIQTRRHACCVSCAGRSGAPATRDLKPQ